MRCPKKKKKKTITIAFAITVGEMKVSDNVNVSKRQAVKACIQKKFISRKNKKAKSKTKNIRKSDLKEHVLRKKVNSREFTFSWLR